MDHEWKIPMQFEGEDCGTATVRRAGLYWQVTCDCAMVTERIVRAYLRTGGGEAGLGVLVPEGGRLRLTRRVAASQMPGEDFTAVTVTEREDGWTPWTGMLAGRPAPEGTLARRAGAGLTAAVPYSNQEPLPQAAALLRSTWIRLEGKPYLALPAEA